MAEQLYDYGMIGLGTMGRNLVLNISEKGYKVIGFDKDATQVETLTKEATTKNVGTTSELTDFVKKLKIPRVVFLLVPAGKIVDDVIDELTPLLSENDVLVDFGNSHYTDTNKRIELLATSSIHFLGIGISGGEVGARFGPCIMPGGPRDVYERISDMLVTISAFAHSGDSCVTWLGSGSAGHYVKMVHNGIEYGIMQLIAEAYHVLKVAGGMDNDELHTIFSKWNEGILHSFLVEITADIFSKKDDLTNKYLIDMVLDSAHQKGTGGWTSEDAMKLQVPIPVIDTAVSMRNLSAYKKERESAQEKRQEAEVKFTGDKNELVDWLEQALYFSMITTYAQGMALLQVASKEYKYGLKLEDIAGIWRGGCIIRSALLEDICSAYHQHPDLSNLMWSDKLAQKLMQSQNAIRTLIKTGIETRIPLPAMMASVAYYDSYRSGWLPANLLQAQRDDFGAHTYERTDREGVFHSHWNKKDK